MRPERRRAISASRSAPESWRTLDAVTWPSVPFTTLRWFVGERGDLREVRDDDDLRLLGEACEAPADLDGRGAADARIDLVEDEGGNGVGSRR